MRIKRLELTNFCQHASRVVEFPAGTTVIMGPNGSGKSNLLAAIPYLLTGEIPLPGTKAGNIRQRSRPKDPAYAAMAFEHGGREYRVRRYLRPKGDAILSCDGDEDVVGENKVTDRIMERLGIDVDLFNSAVMTGQGRMLGFLGHTPAKQAEVFQRLFRLDRAAVLYEALGKHMAGITVQSVSESLATCRQELANAEAEEAACVAAIGTDNPAEVSQRLAYCRQTVDLHANQVADNRTVAEAAATLALLDSQQAGYAATIATYDEGLADLGKASVPAAAEAGRWQTLRDELFRWESTKTFRHNTEQAIAAAEARIATPPPEHPYPDVIRATVQLRRDEAAATASGYCQFIAQFDNPELAEPTCPTCGTKSAAFHQKAAWMRAELPAVRDLIARYDAQLKAFDDYAVALGTHAAAVRNAVIERDRLRSQLTPVGPEGNAPVIDEVAAARAAAAHKEIVDAIVTLQAERAATQAGIDALLPQRKPVLARLEASRSRLSQHARLVTDDEAATASAALPGLLASDQRLRQLVDQLTRGRETLAAKRTQLANLQAAEARAAKERQWLALCGEMRGLVHHDGAPKFVVRRCLDALAARTNEHLSRFNTQFAITPADTVGFNAVFPDGVESPATRLSGGQQTALAVTFQVAINSLYANIGLLGLDEPTAYLDDDHIDGLISALTYFREFAATTGLQVIMSTHERQLAPLFDAVVQL